MSTPAGSSRCAAHPGRPAVDLCPLCARPRSGADVLGGSCAVCGGGPATDPRPTELFTYLSPAVVGALCGGAAEAAARHPGRSPIGSRVCRGGLAVDRPAPGRSVAAPEGSSGWL